MFGLHAKWYAVIAACLAVFMASVDNLVLNVALPTIARDLEATTGQLQWIVAAYTLIFASVQIMAGGLGDRFGRKRWFLTGLVVFTAASIMGALSPSIEVLIAARAVQGLGAAFLFPLSLALISAAFPPAERGKALGIWGAVAVSGLVFGPIVGGALVGIGSWQWAFWINVPIGLIAFAFTARFVRESSGTARVDVPGTALITGSLAALTWGLIEAGERGWSDTLVLAAFVGAALLLAAFVVVEARTERPMIPLRMFRSSTFSGANFVGFALSFLISGVAFYNTLYFQSVHGYTPLQAGMALLPMAAAMMIGSPVAGSLLIPRFGTSKLIAAGMTTAGLGVLLLLLTGAEAGYFTAVPGLVVVGLGMSLTMAPSATAVLNSVENAKSGVASAVNGAVRETGTAFGVAVLGTLLSRAYLSAYESSPGIQNLRSDPQSEPLRPFLDLVGSSVGFAGQAVEGAITDPRLEQFGAALETVRQASARAFMVGMDQAIVVSSVAAIATGILAYLLIKDDIADSVDDSTDDSVEPEDRPDGDGEKSRTAARDSVRTIAGEAVPKEGR